MKKFHIPKARITADNLHIFMKRHGLETLVSETANKWVLEGPDDLKELDILDAANRYVPETAAERKKRLYDASDRLKALMQVCANHFGLDIEELRDEMKATM